MILSCQNIEKSFGTDTVLKNVSFYIEEYEKAAIVGTNGAGKSTLLKIITGGLEADAGTVTFQKGITYGYLEQHPTTDTHRKIFDEVISARQDLLDAERSLEEMEARMQTTAPEEMETFLEAYHKKLDWFEDQNGYALRSEVSGVLKGLGFAESDFDKYCDELSGGQKTRVALARLLVMHPDLILLDEPTNHLDIGSIEWLETFLLNYKGAVVIVAHDRYFLDKIVSKVIALDRHEASVYSGNYTDYTAKERQRREAALRAYENQQRTIRHEQQVIDKLKQFNREKSVRRAESREKALERIELLEKPQAEHEGMRITLEPRITSGNDVLRVEGLAKSYGEKHLFADLNFEIKRGERVALIGPNGTGKTTLLKILNRKVAADAGSFTPGTNVAIGYYDQEQQNLHMEKTLFSEISDVYPDLSNTKIRTVLAAFLFTGDDVFKKVSDLSGGERGRLSLAKLMLGDANFLILDEPTNHLDMESKEILEDALNSYTGTVLFVSHDRYFVNRTATRILHLTNRRLDNYIGNYDYYLEKKEDVERAAAAGGSQAPETTDAAGTGPAGKKTGSSRLDWQEQKARQAEARKRENQLKKVEDRIGELEALLGETQAAYEDPEVASDAEKLREIHTACTRIESELETLYAAWEELAEHMQ